MGSPEIKALAFGDPSVMAEMAGIATGAGITFPAEKLSGNLLDGNPRTTCLGAFVDGELAAVNAFMAHDVLIGGSKSVAFQSAWSATMPIHQGKGLFRSIINFAKRELASRGAAFIFGFPNPVCESIYVGKLGFSRIPMKRVVLPTFPSSLAGKSLGFRKHLEQLASDSVVRFDQYQNHAWKRHEHPGLLFLEDYTNMIWGLVVDRRVPVLGVRKVLLAGGCEINKPQLFGQVLGKLRKLHGIDMVRFVAAKGSMIISSSRFVIQADRTESFVYFPLRTLPADVRFDAHVGLQGAY